MKIPARLLAMIVIIVILLLMLIYIFNIQTSSSEIKYKDVFTQGCIKYCSEIERSSDITREAIKKSEELEGSDFIDACKKLYQDIKYNWQCWNRNCCTFSVYSPL